MEENAKNVSSYVVPISILSAFIINTDNPEELNNEVLSILEKTSQNELIKSIFGEASKKLSEAFNDINKDMTVLLVPNAFLPVKDKQDSEVVVNFVEQFNTALQEKMKEANEQ